MDKLRRGIVAVGLVATIFAIVPYLPIKSPQDAGFFLQAIPLAVVLALLAVIAAGA